MKNWSIAALGFGIMSLASACTVDATSGNEQTAAVSTVEALCANQDGTNAYLAALATATARETTRWLPGRDFQWNYTTNRLELSGNGKAKCADKKCFNVQELLNMQSVAADGLVVFPGGDKLNTQILSQRLKALWDRQMICNSRPDNHAGDDCPTEYQRLTLTRIDNGSCDRVFTFKATGSDGVSTLAEPAQLANQLIWAGYTKDSSSNPYLAFQSTASTVAIDPTLGLTEGDATSSGSCAAACTMISSTSVTGKCCSCNGVTKTYSRSPFSANTYLCK